jgi:hypothetical protein
MERIERRSHCPKGEVVGVESWIADGSIYTVINYEDGGYDFRVVDLDLVEHEFEYVPEGC